MNHTKKRWMDDTCYHLVERLEFKHVPMGLLDTSFVTLLEAEKVLVLPVYQKLLATIGLDPHLE